MGSEGLFSVIIPVYNRAHLIERTLESVSRQSLAPLEVIVVDDGSRDNSAECAGRFSFVRVIRQDNSGPGAARNRGIEAARGEYIACLDSDDVWFPWSLEHYARAIERNGRPAFLAGKPFLFSDPQQLSEPIDGLAEYRSFPDYLSTGEEWLWYGVSSFVIRRDVLVSAGAFRTENSNGEDAELALRLGTAPGFVQITRPFMFGYRMHDGNITADMEKNQRGLQMLIDGEQQGRFPGGPQRAAERASIISRHVRPAAVECVNQGDVAAGMRLYRSVFREALVKRRWKFLFGLPALAARQRLLGPIARTRPAVQ